MKTIKLLIILSLGLITSGCYASGGWRYHSHYYPYSQYTGNESIGHWRRENELREQIHLQNERIEEIRLQQQLRYNEEYIQKEQLRLQNNWR